MCQSKFKWALIAVLLVHTVALSQCAMCRAALASNGNTSQAEALNDGIVYLMAIPYIAVAVVGYFIYRMYTRKSPS